MHGVLGQKHIIKVHHIFIASRRTNFVITTCNAATILIAFFDGGSNASNNIHKSYNNDCTFLSCHVHVSE